ncbi:MAG: ZIP family metal transporter [Syntrophomonadaceae bacterium]
MDNSLFWSLIAGACTALGAGMLFLKKNWSNRGLGFFLGLASGVMVAVVAFDMLPSALLFPGYPKALVGFASGMVLLWLVDYFVFDHAQGKESLLGLGYLIMLGIALHDLPEGMAIALGGEMKDRTGMVIALAIGIHNIPEGMAIAAPLIMGGMKRISIILKVSLLGLITPLGTVVGLAAVSIVPGLLPFLLGFASGIMIYLVIYQLWPQAGRKDLKTRRWGFWLGMIIILAATFI